PMPGAFFEELVRGPEVPAALHRLVALDLAVGGSGESYRIASVGLQDFVREKYPEREIRERHDRLAALAGAAKTEGYFSSEAAAFPRPNGCARLAASLAWADLANRSARRGLWQSAQDYFQSAEQYAPPSEIDLRFQHAIDQGRCLVQRGLLNEAKEYLDSLLRQFSREKKKNRLFLASLCERLGVVEIKRGKADKATDYFQAGLRCLEPGREPLEQYLALKNFLGNIELLSGDHAAAIVTFRESYEAAQSLPWDRRRILTNNDLGA